MTDKSDDTVSTTAVTDAQVTQIALEQWGSGTPDARITQIALEQWASIAGVQTFSAGHV